MKTGISRTKKSQGGGIKGILKFFGLGIVISRLSREIFLFSFFVLGVCFFAGATVSAATYYVRADGTAANKAAAIGPTTEAVACMSMTTFNAQAYSDGDIIIFSNRGGDFVVSLIVPTGGSSADSKITYQGETDYRPKIDAENTRFSCISNTAKNYVLVKNFEVTRPTDSGVYTTNAVGVVYEDILSTYSGNQAFQNIGTASVNYNNITGTNCVDDGFSMHDNTVAVINGATFTDNNQHVNIVSNANLTANNVTISGCAGASCMAVYLTASAGGVQATFNNLSIDFSAANGNVLRNDGATGLSILTVTNFKVNGVPSGKYVVYAGQNSTTYVNNGTIFDSDSNGNGTYFRGASDTIVYATNIIFNNLDYGYYLLAGSVYTFNSINNFGNVRNSPASPTCTNCLAVNPLFSIPGTDFSLRATSTLIDVGAIVDGRTTDINSSPIYGTPDIGAYEYQPPYTQGTNLVSTSSPIRIYADGQFRYTTATSSGAVADFTVTPSIGTYYNADYRQYLDVTLSSWLTTGTKNKEWIATSTIATTTIYTIGDLASNQYYTIKLDNAVTSTISGAGGTTCTNSICLSDGTGQISFTYTGGYSTHTFTLTANSSTISSVVSTPSTISSSITWTTNELASSKVDYGLTTTYASSTTESDTGTRVLNHTVSLTDLLSCTNYHYRVRSTDSATNETIGSDNSFTTTGCVGNATISSSTASTVTTAAGGTVTLLDIDTSQGITLTIPESFSTTDANFQIKQLDATNVISTVSTPSGYTTVGSFLYDLKALSGNSVAITSFDEPLTITLTYTTSEISSLDESSLKIYRYDTSWTQLSSCTVNTSANTISCTTENFSVFGIFGTPPVAVATGGGGLPAGAYDAPQAPAGGFKIFINDGEKKIPAFAGMTKGDGMTDGVGMTDNRLVNLKLFAGADTTKMAISNNKDFINASQEEYTTTKQWDLCSRPTYLTNTNTTNTTCPDGIYTVYARFYTKYGQPSEIVSATVTLCHADNTVQCHSGESRNLIQDTEKIPAFAGMTGKKITQLLKLGSRGTQVIWLQDILKQLNYFPKNISSTGYFGATTRQAVIKLQKAYKLTPYPGWVGPGTRSVLNGL